MRLFIDYSEHLEDLYSCVTAGCDFVKMACSATFQDLAEMRVVIDLDKYRSVEAVPSIFDSRYSLLVAEKQTSILPVRKTLGVYRKDVANALVKAICLAWSNSEPVFVVSEFLKNYKGEKTADETSDEAEKSFNFFSNANSKDIEDTCLYRFGKQAFDVMDEAAANLINVVDKAFDRIDDAFAELKADLDNVFGEDLSDTECSPDSEDEPVDADDSDSVVSDDCDTSEVPNSEDAVDSDLSEDIKSSDVFVDNCCSESEKVEDAPEDTKAVEDTAEDVKDAESSDVKSERKGRRRR